MKWIVSPTSMTEKTAMFMAGIWNRPHNPGLTKSKIRRAGLNLAA